MGVNPLRRKESEIQLDILRYLRTIGAYSGKTKTMGTPRTNKWGKRYFSIDPYNFHGFPDLTGFYKGRLFFVEVKGKGGTQSDAQKEFQRRCIEAKIEYILAYSVSDVYNILKDY